MIFITRLISGRTSKMVKDQCEMVFNLCCEFFFEISYFNFLMSALSLEASDLFFLLVDGLIL